MALYVVFEERQHLTFLSRKNEVQMIFEVSEKNIKILDILFNENYQLHTCFDETHFGDRICKDHAPDY